MKKRTKTDGDLLACMDYLHGHVIDGNDEAACFYEYARESKTLRMAARLFRKKPSADSAEIYRRVDRKHHCGCWFIQPEWGELWRCLSFPVKSWNQLEDAERQAIDWLFPGKRIQPLPMMEVTTHDAMGNFATLKRMADKLRTQKKGRAKHKKRRQKVFPIVDRGQWLDVLFTLNFAKTKKRLRQEFETWLEKPENKERLGKYQGRSVGTTGIYKDRLKDLAAWRLHRELGDVKAQLFINKHRKCDSEGNFLPFHDSRGGQSEKLSSSETPLYSDHTGVAKAKSRAEAYLVELMPYEFDKEAERESMEAARAAFEEISKSSS